MSEGIKWIRRKRAEIRHLQFRAALHTAWRLNRDDIYRQLVTGLPVYDALERRA